VKVLSLFSGGGLGDYGLELAGMEIVGQVEIDEYCQKILSLRWPDVPKWRDIREVKGSEVLKQCGRIDIISGGFPCQDISTANTNGKGIEGEKSGLWKEMYRLICEIRPKFVFVENVSALLHRGLGVVLGDLAACGYDAEWDCIPASAIGAPHRRDRVWIVAYAGLLGQTEYEIKTAGIEQCGQTLADSKSMGRKTWADDSRNGRKRRPSNKSYNSSEACNATGERFQDGSEETVFRPQENKVPERSNWWAVEPAVGRVAHGTPKRVDRLKMLGNGQVVQVVQWIGEQIMKFNALDSVNAEIER